MSTTRSVRFFAFICAALLWSAFAFADGDKPAKNQESSQAASEPAVESNKPAEVSSIGFVGKALITVASLAALGLVLLVVTPDGKKTVVKNCRIVSRTFWVEIGFGGLFRFFVNSVILGLSTAILKYSASGKFDLQVFLVATLTLTLSNLTLNLLEASPQGKKLLSPGAGQVWRSDRKAETGAILKRITVLARSKKSPSPTEVRTLLSDILGVIVKHVRDHRGCSKVGVDVFANILIDDEKESLIVVARNPDALTPQYRREVPQTYKKVDLFCSRVLSSNKTLTLSELVEAYPEGPKNKPYRSILAIPIISSDDSETYGVLSIDCTFPYFFDSFSPGKIENDMQISLLPYTQLIVLTLELLVGNPRWRMVKVLLSDDVTSESTGSQS